MKKTLILVAFLVASPAFAEQQKQDAAVDACSELAARDARISTAERLNLVKYAATIGEQLAAANAKVKDLEAQLAKAKEPAPATPDAPASK